MAKEVAITGHAESVYSYLLRCRRDEKNFLLRKDLKYNDFFAKDIKAVKKEANEVISLSKGTSKKNGDLAVEIMKEIDIYSDYFYKIVESWKIKGLDQNSGLHKTFRDAVHRMSDNVLHNELDELYFSFLNTKKNEKDFVRTGNFLNSRNNFKKGLNVEVFIKLRSMAAI